MTDIFSKLLTPRINVDKRGKISSGIKATTSAGKEYPKAVDYFSIGDFPELVRSYGEKPNKLVLFFPSNNIADFLDVKKVLYGSNHSKIRQCDSQECTHRIKETVKLANSNDQQTFEAGEVSPCICTSGNYEVPENKKCKFAMYLKAYVADKQTGSPLSPQCYLFYSGSINSADGIYSEIKKISDFTGGLLVGTAFGLSVEMVEGREAGKKFPIWNLKALGTVNQIKLAIQNYLFNYKEMTALTEPEQKQIGAGASADIDELFSNETFEN